MNRQNENTVPLKKGNYLAPHFSISSFDDLLVGITTYDAPIETGVWHFHEIPMISFVLYGSNTEYRKGRSIRRNSGSANYYHAHELHKNVYDQFPSKHISLELDLNYLKKLEYTEADIQLAVEKSQDSIFTFIRLMNEAQTNDVQSKNTVEMLFLSFMENALVSKDNAQFPPWMSLVREILNDRWNENISLKELSNKVHVHPTTISKHFRKFFGCTLGEYTRKLKVEHSINFLHSSNYSLTEIAYICGFSDQSHFIRTFKSMTGYLPKKYCSV
nr:AraC family transcriptional regulator [uncultured Allomuricauda sp.]